MQFFKKTKQCFAPYNLPDCIVIFQVYLEISLQPMCSGDLQFFKTIECQVKFFQYTMSLKMP